MRFRASREISKNFAGFRRDGAKPPVRAFSMESASDGRAIGVPGSSPFRRRSAPRLRAFLELTAYGDHTANDARDWANEVGEAIDSAFFERFERGLVDSADDEHGDVNIDGRLGAGRVDLTHQELGETAHHFSAHAPALF